MRAGVSSFRSPLMALWLAAQLATPSTQAGDTERQPEMPNQRRPQMEMWLANYTKERLTDLRVQNCVLFKGSERLRGADQ
jgi:hypothetical protein